MSYTTLPAEKVIEYCEKYIYLVACRRKDKLEGIINKLAKTRLWNFKKMGYEKAYNMLCNGDAVMNYQIPFDVLNVRSDKEDMAYNLLLLARNGDPVMVSDKHAFIFDI